MKATDNTFTFDGRTYKKGDEISFTVNGRIYLNWIVQTVNQHGGFSAHRPKITLGLPFRVADIRPIHESN